MITFCNDGYPYRDKSVGQKAITLRTTIAFAKQLELLTFNKKAKKLKFVKY